VLSYLQKVSHTVSPFWPVRLIPSRNVPRCRSAPFPLENLSFMRAFPSPTLFFDFANTILTVYCVAQLVSWLLCVRGEFLLTEDFGGVTPRHSLARLYFLPWADGDLRARRHLLSALPLRSTAHSKPRPRSVYIINRQNASPKIHVSITEAKVDFEHPH
jgi:hypothetical protein